MVQSLAIPLNRVEEENKIPIQWRETKKEEKRKDTRKSKRDISDEHSM